VIRVSCVEDLSKLMASARRKLAQRAKKVEVKIHLGSCGIASGARGVQEAFAKEVESRKLGNIVITEAACIGPCGREPIVTIIHPQKGEVVYADVIPERVPTIVERHLIDGESISEGALD